jgi:hypothetical protein
MHDEREEHEGTKRLWGLACSQNQTLICFVLFVFVVPIVIARSAP